MLIFYQKHLGAFFFVAGVFGLRNMEKQTGTVKSKILFTTFAQDQVQIF